MKNTSIIVSNSEELFNTIASATGGEIIYLENNMSGYNLNLHAPTNFPLRKLAEPVTITSLNNETPAKLKNVWLSGVDNIKFRDLEVSPDPDSSRWAFHVRNSSNISIENINFYGAADQPWWNAGSRGTDAFRAKKVDGLKFLNNEINGFGFGAEIIGSDHISIAGNVFHNLQVDGLRLAAVQHVRVTGNLMRDWLGVAYELDHADFIQMWASGTNRPSLDVTIADNALITTNRWATQSMLLSAGNGYGSHDFMIKNNIIYNGQLHGITVKHVENLDVLDNIILHNIESGYRRFDTAAERSGAPHIRIEGVSTNVDVTDNITVKVYVGTDAVVAETGNLAPSYDDPLSPLYYKTLLGALEPFRNDLSLSAFLDALGVEFNTSPINAVPTAQDDYAQTVAGETISISVLRNDFDPDGDTLTVTAVGSAAQGEASLIGNEIVYTPEAHFSGSDSFSYRITDPLGASATATVTITVLEDSTDPNMRLMGYANDNFLIGGTGDDRFLLRWGSDTALGGAGADSFVIDGRYIDDGDHHRIEDLSFSDGDAVWLRNFDFKTFHIGALEDLRAAAEAGIRLSQSATGDAMLSCADSDGHAVTLELGGVAYDAAATFF